MGQDAPALTRVLALGELESESSLPVLHDPIHGSTDRERSVGVTLTVGSSDVAKPGVCATPGLIVRGNMGTGANLSRHTWATPRNIRLRASFC
jgi:hypothetical protein